MTTLEDFIKLADAATRGPWEAVNHTMDDGEWWIGFEHPEWGQCSIASTRWGCDEAQDHGGTIESNAQFIAASRTLGPAMAKALIEAEGALRFVIHRDAMWTDETLPVKQSLATIERLRNGGV